MRAFASASVALVLAFGASPTHAGEGPLWGSRRVDRGQAQVETGRQLRGAARREAGRALVGFFRKAPGKTVVRVGQKIAGNAAAAREAAGEARRHVRVAAGNVKQANQHLAAGVVTALNGRVNLAVGRTMQRLHLAGRAIAGTRVGRVVGRTARAIGNAGRAIGNAARAVKHTGAVYGEAIGHMTRNAGSIFNAGQIDAWNQRQRRARPSAPPPTLQGIGAGLGTAR